MSKRDSQRVLRKESSNEAQSDRYKVAFELYLRRFDNLPPSLEGHVIYIEWKNSKAVTGVTKRTLVREAAVSWDEKLIFEAKFLRSTSGERLFKGKGLRVRLFDERASSSIDSAEIPLSTHCEENGSELRKVQFTKSKATLTYRIKSRFVKINDQRILSEVSGAPLPLPSSAQDKSKVVTIGSRYYLTRTDTQISDPTADDSLGSDDDVEDLESDDVSPLASRRSSSSLPRRRHSSKTSRSHLSPSDSSKDLEMKALSEQNESLEKQIAQFRVQIRALKKRLEVAEKELGHSISSADIDVPEVEPREARVKALSESQGKARTPPVVPEADVDSPDLKERVKQALLAHSSKSVKNVETNTAKEELDALELVALSSFTTLESDNRRVTEAYRSLAAVVTAENAPLYLRYMEAFALRRAIPLSYHPLLYWFSTTVALAETLALPSMHDLAQKIGSTLVAQVLQDFSNDLAAMFCSPPPQKLPRLVLGIMNRPLTLHDLLGRLSDIIGADLGLKPAALRCLLVAILDSIDRFVLSHLRQIPCNATTALNVKMAISALMEWIQLGLIRNVIRLDGVLPLSSQAATLLTLDFDFALENRATLLSLFPKLPPIAVFELFGRLESADAAKKSRALLSLAPSDSADPTRAFPVPIVL